MIRASDRHIVATRSWRVGSGELLPPFERVDGGPPLAEAWRRYHAGLVEIATGRDVLLFDGVEHVMESLYAIPRTVPRRFAGPPVGAGYVKGAR